MFIDSVMVAGMTGRNLEAHHKANCAASKEKRLRKRKERKQFKAMADRMTRLVVEDALARLPDNASFALRYQVTQEAQE